MELEQQRSEWFNQSFCSSPGRKGVRLELDKARDMTWPFNILGYQGKKGIRESEKERDPPQVPDHACLGCQGSITSQLIKVFWYTVYKSFECDLIPNMFEHCRVLLNSHYLLGRSYPGLWFLCRQSWVPLQIPSWQEVIFNFIVNLSI